MQPTSRLKVNPPLGEMPTLEIHPVAALRIDPSYQRSLDRGPSQTLIRRIAQFWDWNLCQPLVCSKRLDREGLYVVDGQHRLAAARLRGDIPRLPCVVTVYAIPGGWSPARRGRALEGMEWHPSRPDWDNLGKLVSDALNAIAFLDDAQICDGRVAKRYGSPERTVVRVTALQSQDAVGESESRGCASARRGPQNERRAGTRVPTRPLNT